MEKSLSPNWRDGHQLLITLGHRLRHSPITEQAIQTATRLSYSASQQLVSPKSYPSQRPCPVCDEKTFYVASWSTLFTGLYTRTCSACGYCDPRKVKMIKQL